MLQKKETLSITFRLLWSGCDKLLRVKYINSVTTNIFHLNKECQTCMEIDVMDMCIKWTDKYSDKQVVFTCKRGAGQLSGWVRHTCTKRGHHIQHLQTPLLKQQR